MTHRTVLFFISIAIAALCALPTVPNAEIADAEKLLDEGWADDAEALLDEFLESSPQNADLYYLLARLYLYKDDSQEDFGGAPWSNLDRIEDYAKKATEIAPNESRYFVILGHGVGLKALRGGKVKMLSRAKSAKKWYERAVELDPNNVDARQSLVQYYMQAPGIAGGSKDKARKQAQAIAEIDSAGGFEAWATIYYHEEDYESLQANIDELLEINPANTSALMEYARVSRYREDFEKELDCLQKTIEIDPENLNTYWHLSRYYTRHEQPDLALKALTRAVEVKPDEAYLYRWVGDYYKKRENWDDAVTWYEKTLEVDPTYLRALYSLGETLYLAGTDLERAKSCFTRYIGSRLKYWWPERALAHYQLARIANSQRNKSAAESQIKTARKLNRDNGEIKALAKKLHVR